MKALDWLKHHPSIIIGALLMLASSGLDGAYMTLLMPQQVIVASWTVSFAWLGLVLNAAADGTDLYLSARIGRLMRSRDAVKMWGGVLLLLVGLAVAAAYSWYFSYLQLTRVLPAFEVADIDAKAKIIAGFIPALIIILGLEDGLSNFSSARFGLSGETKAEESKPEPKPKTLMCPVCGATETQKGEPLLTQAALSGHMRAHANGNGTHPRERVEEGV